MRRLLKEYFTFSKKERNGTIVLILLIVTVIFYPQIQSLFVTEQPADFSAFQKEIAEFKKQTSAAPDNLTKKDSTSKKKEIIPVETISLFYFNPNTIGLTEWKQLGVNERTAKAILKYVSKGGRFNTVTDLKRIYNLKEGDFNRLAPFVRIEKDKFKSAGQPDIPKQTVAYVPKTKTKIDINSADSAMLESLYGIGATLASRIINFRNQSGGFFTKEQLLDVYGLKPETYEKVKDYVEVSEPNITLISVNTATEEMLAINPYFRYKIAKVLVNYRTAHGPYQSLEAIKNCGLIDDVLFEKVRPYLSL